LLEKIIDFLNEKNVEIIQFNDKEIITKHIIGKSEIKIKGLLKTLEDNKLPQYYVCNRDEYGLLAHIGWKNKENIGLCCSGSDDVLSLNYHDLGKVYYEGLLKALDLLIPTINDSQENHKQIMDEYLGHLDWIENKEHSKIIFMGRYLSGINMLEAYLSRDNSNDVIITHEEHDINKDYCLVANLSKQKKHGISYLLELDKLPLPPIPKESIKKWWINLLNKQSDSFIKDLTEIAKYQRSNHFYFICYMKYNEEILTFCVSCKNSRKKDYAPITETQIGNWKISIVKIIQHTKEFLLPRSGGTLDFQNKKILLVGCGSVGSFISQQLVQAGIGKLTLSDPDIFKADNLYRHNLSMIFNNHSKSRALRLELEYEYPYTKIEAQVLELSKIQKEVLIKQDLIIIAIGNPTQERSFNEYLKKENINVNVIYAWLEGYGLGGHAIYMDSTMSNGCLQCNYLDINEEVPILHSNMNFLYPNQNVTKDIGGCGTLFLPYSHLDAEQTALMVSRTAIDVLSNKLNSSARISWKGPSKDAEAKGLQLTHRYYKYTTSIYEKYKQGFCFVCS